MMHQVSGEYTEAQATTSPLAVHSPSGYPHLFSGGKGISNGLFVLPGTKSKTSELQNANTLACW